MTADSAAAEAPAEDAPKDQPRELEIVNLADDHSKKATAGFVKSFTVTWKNRETGVVKVGTFTATRPGLGKLGQIAVFKAKLNGGEKVDFNTDFMHTMMADLHYILTDVPEWWTPDTFFTANPLREVWDHVGAWLSTFRGERVG